VDAPLPRRPGPGKPRAGALNAVEVAFAELEQEQIGGDHRRAVRALPTSTDVAVGWPLRPATRRVFAVPGPGLNVRTVIADRAHV
jgi:hypothetical protein